MTKYAVSLGVISKMVTLEAANAQQALDNVLTLIEPQGIVMIPKENDKKSHWFSRNIENPKDEIVVKDTDSARKIISKLRQDVVDIFWFVSLQEETTNKTKKIPNNKNSY